MTKEEYRVRKAVEMAKWMETHFDGGMSPWDLSPEEQAPLRQMVPLSDFVTLWGVNVNVSDLEYEIGEMMSMAEDMVCYPDDPELYDDTAT